jgi:rhodanese-related sulfurtransferase
MKIYKIIILLILTIFLVGCEDEPEEIIDDLPPEITSETIISMDNLDEYMMRDDVQYVDLRNYDARYNSGWIFGFEQIPFFDYLDYRVFVRDGTYDFTPDQLIEPQELERLFDPEKAIFLYADGCIRSGYVKDALNHLGYERVYVIGGFYEYTGEYRIDGIGGYELGNQFYRKYTNNETNYTYLMYGDFDVANNIVTIRFDILDENNNTLRCNCNEDEVDYDSMLTSIENYIIGTFGNFNNIYLEMQQLETASIYQIDGVDWQYFDDLIKLVEMEYIE